MATSYDVELERIKRQQQIADAMTASGLEPIQVNRTAGPYVAPVHWAEVLGKWAQVYAGKRASDKAAERQLEIVGKQEQNRADRMRGYMGGLPSATPGQTPGIAPPTASTRMPVPQEPATPQFEARGMLAQVLGDIGVKPNTVSPGVREKYTGPVDALPSYLQPNAPAPQAAAPQQAQPAADPYQGEIARLQQQFQIAQLMAADSDPQLAAFGLKEAERLGKLMQEYTKASINQTNIRTVGNNLVNLAGGVPREIYSGDVVYEEPTLSPAGDGETWISRAKGGRGRPVITNAPTRSAGNTNNVYNVEESAFAREVGKDNADYLGLNRDRAATAWNKIGLADGLDNNIAALERLGATTGPLTNLRNWTASLAQELNITLDAKQLERLVRTGALNAAGIDQLIDLFNQPGMSAYGLTAGETAELKRSFAAGTQPIVVLKAISQRLRTRATGELNNARNIYREAQRDYGRVPSLYDPDLTRGMRATSVGAPGSSRDNPRTLD